MVRVRTVAALAAALVAARAQEEAGGEDVFLFGSSKVDVTGPVAQNSMMGYADPLQRSGGLLNRLLVRSYVLQKDAASPKVAIVHLDLHSVPLGLHQGVVAELERQAPGEFEARNVLLHSQHTHASPGGLHHYYLYAFSTLGMTPLQLEMVQDRIVRGVLEASAAAETPHRLHFAHTEIANCSVNRSPEAYANNPAEERARFADDRNTRMTVVKVAPVDAPDTLAAIWTFFAVHTTSLTKHNRMISSDNKGFAAWLMEARRPAAFSAAFFQTEAGDISPNTVDLGDGSFTGVHGADFVRNAEEVGRCQARAAEAVLARGPAEWTAVRGEIVANKAFFDFSRFEVPGRGTTCPAVSGTNMAAGTEDGRGLPFVYEGNLRTRESWVQFGGQTIFRGKVSAEVERCQYPKHTWLPTGLTTPPSSPQVLPVQVLALGNFALAAVPFEVTTMSGRRIAAAMRAALPAADHVEVAAISNGYAGYLTTPEEYATQHYEGASTHFGPLQLPAVLEMLGRVARVALSGDAAGPVPGAVAGPPPVPRGVQVLNAVGTTFADGSSAAPWARFGDLQSWSALGPPTPATDSFVAGDVPAATFWCPHPMNTQLDVGSFCDVEARAAGGEGPWETLRTDHDWDVRFIWQPAYIFFSTCTCQWVVPHASSDEGRGLPANASALHFRLRHRGVSLVQHKLESYEGVSPVFRVDPLATRENAAAIAASAAAEAYTVAPLPTELAAPALYLAGTLALAHGLLSLWRGGASKKAASS